MTNAVEKLPFMLSYVRCQKACLLMYNLTFLKVHWYNGTVIIFWCRHRRASVKEAALLWQVQWWAMKGWGQAQGRINLQPHQPYGWPDPGQATG